MSFTVTLLRAANGDSLPDRSGTRRKKTAPGAHRVRGGAATVRFFDAGGRLLKKSVGGLPGFVDLFGKVPKSRPGYPVEEPLFGGWQSRFRFAKDSRIVSLPLELPRQSGRRPETHIKVASQKTCPSTLPDLVAPQGSEWKKIPSAPGFTAGIKNRRDPPLANLRLWLADCPPTAENSVSLELRRNFDGCPEVRPRSGRF